MLTKTSQPFSWTLIRVVGIFWLIAKIISWKVWLSSRLFPIVPVFGVLTNVPAWIHLLLYVLSLCLLCLVIVKPGIRTSYSALLVIETASCLLDYARWQPWEYQYLFILFVCITGRKDKNITTATAAILIGLYFYSGIHKLNHGFLLQVWDNMLLKSFFKVPHAIRTNEVVMQLGYIVGITEIIGGLSLLMPRARKTAAILLIVMHVFNLVWLSPVGIGYNIIVWPWNCLMISILYLLFLRGKQEFSPAAMLTPANLLVTLCFGIMPVFNFIGLWDNYLSGSLYSGKLPLMAICTTEKQLQAYAKQNDRHNLCNGKPLITLQSWAMAELNVPPYPELRVYQKMERILTTRYTATRCYLYYYGSPLKKEL